MKRTIPEEVLRAIQPAQLAAYLRAQGWQEHPGVAGHYTVWLPAGDNDSDEVDILLPIKNTFSDYPGRIAAALRLLAGWEERAQSAILADIRGRSDATTSHTRADVQWLPADLEQELQQALTVQSGWTADEMSILETLTRQPAPEEVLALYPSLHLQTRIRELLERNKHQTLAPQETAELARYAVLDQLVRLAKANAYSHIEQAA